MSLLKKSGSSRSIAGRIDPRNFTKGKVVVNAANGTTTAVKLSGEHYDPDSRRTVKEVRLAPLTAKILVIPATP